MKLSIDSSRLPDYLTRQIEQCFPDGNERWQSDVRHCCSVALERIEYCFRHIPKKYYQDQGEPVFNHMNADHYASFLYFVSYQAAQAGNEALAERAFYLNKALHGLDLFYAVKMPDIFMLVHPVGTVIGNASFSDYLVIYQNVTIGADVAGIYPVFAGDNVIYSGASVIGNCHIGRNSVIGARSFIRKQSDGAENSLYSGLYPAVRVTPNTGSVRQDFFTEKNQ